jgi:hypothetical protein
MQYVTIDSSKLIRNSSALWKGHHLVAASGDSVIEMYDGLDDTGIKVCTIKIKNNEHDDHFFSGVAFNRGVYVKIVSGSVSGSIFVE